jgi:hypothetical protein
LVVVIAGNGSAVEYHTNQASLSAYKSRIFISEEKEHYESSAHTVLIEHADTLFTSSRDTGPLRWEGQAADSR